jgi:hypothetical protein
MVIICFSVTITEIYDEDPPMNTVKVSEDENGSTRKSPAVSSPKGDWGAAIMFEIKSSTVTRL